MRGKAVGGAAVTASASLLENALVAIRAFALASLDTIAACLTLALAPFVAVDCGGSVAPLLATVVG